MFDGNSIRPRVDLTIQPGSPLSTLLAHFFSTEPNPSRFVTIINKLTGKALEVENSSTSEGARIQQFVRNEKAHQLWTLKFTNIVWQPKALKQMNPCSLRFWPNILPFFQAGYLLIAKHSGLCLDVPCSRHDNFLPLRQALSNRASNQLWNFVPDKDGFNFIVNVRSGRVLDAAEGALENFGAVQLSTFKGTANQRWQLIYLAHSVS